MASIANYPQPVTVNGYNCRSGSEVDLAAKRIDPAHPNSGPNDIYAEQDMSRSPEERARIAEQRATIADSESYSQTGAVVGQALPGAVLKFSA